MPDPEGDAPDLPSGPPAPLDALIGELRARVEERRRRGEYPPGLEDDLDRHVKIILGHRGPAAEVDLRGPLGRAEAAASRGFPQAPTESKVPGGQAVHATVARVVGRQTQALAQQMTGFADPVVATLRALVEAVEQLGRELHVDVAAHLEAIYERQAAQERAMTRAGLDPGPWTPPPPPG